MITFHNLLLDILAFWTRIDRSSVSVRICLLKAILSLLAVFISISYGVLMEYRLSRVLCVLSLCVESLNIDLWELHLALIYTGGGCEGGFKIKERILLLSIFLIWESTFIVINFERLRTGLHFTVPYRFETKWSYSIGYKNDVSAESC